MVLSKLKADVERSSGWLSRFRRTSTTCSSRNNTPGASYCTWSPDYDCYDEGWPRCCEDDEGDCPRNSKQIAFTLSQKREGCLRPLLVAAAAIGGRVEGGRAKMKKPTAIGFE